jgi:protein-tyrosine phosphatase
MQFTACSNFRRVGSLAPVLFRSNHLGALGESDARQIEQLAIRRVLDFRGVNERASAVCALRGVTVHSLPIEPTIVQVLTDLVDAGHQLTSDDIVAHMQDTYRGFVRHNTPRFAQFFGHLLESGEPTVFHCTAGKDYLLTNERLKMPEGVRYGLTPEAAMVLWRVQPEFLDAAFDAVRSDYGGLEPYFKEGLGLGHEERERLRELYLQPTGSQLP